MQLQKQISAEKRHDMMTGQPISSLIWKMAVPTIISMLVSAIYNMADTYFVSQISTSASGAVGIVFSIMAIIMAIGLTFGVGGGSYISRLLGEKNTAQARRASATVFYLSIFIGLLLTIFGLIYLEPLMRLLGATDTILPYARDYAQYILIGAPYMAASYVMNNLLRSEGSAVLSMIGIGVGGLLNIALDPLFIFMFKMGIAGAAIATILSQFVGFCVLLSHFLRKKSTLSLNPKHISLRWRMFREIGHSGLPTFYRQGLASISAVLLNVYAKPYGDPAIAGMSIVTRVMMFITSVLIGFGQGFQPVAGFNYGAKRYDRLWDAFWYSVKMGLIGLTALGAIGVIFAPGILAIFRAQDATVIGIGSFALRLQCITLPMQVWVIMCNMMFQSLGLGFRASVLAMARQGLFFIPAIMILPGILGLSGVQYSQPLADVMTFVLSVPLAWGLLKKIDRQRKEMGQMTPNASEGSEENDEL